MTYPGSPAWTAVGLPTGVSINATTGKISGAAGSAGVYVVTVSATNVAPEPTPGTGTMQFVIGISSEVAPDSGSDQMVISVTLPEGRVSVPGAGQAAGAALFGLKQNDTRLLVLRFVDAAGVRVDLDLDTLRLTLKKYEPEGAVATAETWQKVGTGATAEYQLPLTLSGSPLAGALSDEEADAGTSFTALAELEWTREITFGGGPLVLRSSSQTFRVAIERDLNSN
jgi:hypothetical protein